MARLTGFIQKFDGTIGGVTFSRENGKTIAREKVTSNNSHTLSQMRQRAQWMNTLNAYRAFGKYLLKGFESMHMRSYNAFISLNAGGGVFLTRHESRQGACVVAPFRISSGKLVEIEVTLGSDNKARTDISLGSLAITGATTVKEFSDAVILNNNDFKNGDAISVFVMQQRVSPATQLPIAKVSSQQVTLDQADNTTLLRSVVSDWGFAVVDGVLGADFDIEGGITWVHSRDTDKGLMVSSQHLVVRNSLLAQYQSESAMEAAIASLGGASDMPYLSPEENGQPANNSQPTPQQPGNTSQFTLTVNAQPANGGTVSGGGTYASGAQATLTATPSSGYSFTRWSDGNTQATRTLTVTESKTLTATFTASTPSGGSTGGTEEG